MSLKFRIGFAGFQHETNTFAPFSTQFKDFENPGNMVPFTIGNSIKTRCSGQNIPISGFMEAGSEFDLIPLSYASAEPGGLVSQDAFDRISGSILSGIETSGKLDGLYFDLHGAMVTEMYDDGEEELMKRVRDLVGPDLPIVTSLDLHGNISPGFIDLINATTIYRTYPHVDMAETGKRAAILLKTVLTTTKPIFKVFKQANFIPPVTSQSTMREPGRTLYSKLEALNDNVVSADMAFGFAPADIPNCGISLFVCGTDEDEVRKTAQFMLDEIHSSEPLFDDHLIEGEQAILKAHELSKSAKKPIIIADPQDNPGAGASGDSTGLISKLLKHKIPALVGMFWDPDAAKACHNAGIDKKITIDIGGRFPKENGPSLKVTGIIKNLSDGKFKCKGPYSFGVNANLGKMAAIHVNLGLDSELIIVLGSNRAQNADQAIFKHIGYDPKNYSIIVVKSAIHFLADYEPISDTVLFAEAPGQNPVKVDKISYTKLRSGVRLGPNGKEFQPVQA